MLEGKNAVIYGGGGAVGAAVARTFAAEGAKVFLAGRTLAALEAVAEGIAAEGGAAVTAEVDALDEAAVDRHADAVAEAAGSIDISFNAIGHGDVHGAPLLDMAFDDFVRPVANAMTTARLTIPEVGGTGVSFDAIESLCRQWACELGPRGVRVAWLRTTGLPEGLHADRFPDYGTGSGGMDRDELVAWMERKTMLGRLASLADVGAAAAFLASDGAGAMTGCMVNLSCGSVPD